MINGKFKHYIITRFNVPYPQVEKDSIPKGIRPGYLKQRFEVFGKYTVPSVKNQTNKDFEWIVLFDKRTPEPFLSLIKKYEEEKVFRAVYVDRMDYSEKAVRELVEDFDISNIPVITSRVDNDDAIVDDYVESIQLVAKDILPNETYLSSPHVFRYDCKDKSLSKYKMRKNHFVTRTGMLDDVSANVYHLSQDEMPKDSKAYTIVPGIHSIEIVHESNLLNSTKYRFRGILSQKEYDKSKATCEFETLSYRDNRKFCMKKSLESLPQNTKKSFKSIKKTIDKRILKRSK